MNPAVGGPDAGIRLPVPLARRDFNDHQVDGGEVGAGHQVTVLYEPKRRS